LWALHSYYTLCPYAPDGSGRILVAGCDLASQTVKVLVLDRNGRVQQQVGKVPATGSFWHTGLWQSWSPDARFVYYQSGTLKSPQVVRHELSSGVQVVVDADLEGIPPSGEPGISCPHGMLYAAGYGDDMFKPQDAPVPFQARDDHGISSVTFDPPQEKLVLSVRQILQQHPDRDRILAADAQVRQRYGDDDGVTLMAYCVRWNPAGDRFLFYFGNHVAAPKLRGEPKLGWVFTADRAMKSIHLALDVGVGRRGVHWGWQPDGECLIGYGSHPDDPARMCLSEVRFDGSEYRMLSEHRSGGHPSVSPADNDLIVTDEGVPGGGAVVFISRKTGSEVGRVPLKKFIGDHEPPGRNALRVCHHPVFNQTGDRVLCNSLPGPDATLVEISL
jgi:hypothetical protein